MPDRDPLPRRRRLPTAYLDTQQSRRQAELALAANRLARLDNRATLCQDVVVALNLGE